MMDDYISRQAALDVARAELDGGTPYDIPGKIERLPAAQSANWNELLVICDNCGHAIRVKKER